MIKVLNRKITKLAALVLVAVFIFAQQSITVNAKTPGNGLTDLINKLIGAETETLDEGAESTEGTEMTDTENTEGAEDTEGPEGTEKKPAVSATITIDGLGRKGSVYLKITNISTNEDAYNDMVNLSEGKSVAINAPCGEYSVIMTNDDGDLKLKKSCFKIKKDGQKINLKVKETGSFRKDLLDILKNNFITIILIIVVYIAYVTVKKRNGTDLKI